MSDVDWSGGAPRSRRFDDVYFSAADGLAESRAVFLEGCGLPDTWRGRPSFSVGELGFGTGLNILALLQLWARDRPRDARLHVFSVEAYPPSASDAAQALASWPELAELAGPLLDRWPRAAGAHRIEWPALGAVLDVVVAEAAEALGGWDGRADAWFLDGFAPSRNPEMWRPEVLALVARRSASAARLATFTVAGAVRRGLEAAGFSVEKRPGHGRKRERLEAVLQAEPAPNAGSWSARPPASTGEVVVVGGGIAAAALARALALQGRRARVIRDGAPGASRFPAALVEPRLELGDTAAARLYAQAFRRAAHLLEATPGVVRQRGMLKLGGPADAERYDRLAASLLHEAGALERRTGPAGRPALWITDGLTLDPAALVDAWLAEAAVVDGRAARLEQTRGGPGWRLLDAQGAVLAEAAVVILAGGAAGAGLLDGFELEPVRGQVSLAPGRSGPPASWGGYCAPTSGGLLFGATHDRGDTGLEVRAEDHRRNLATLAQAYPEISGTLDPDALLGFTGLRAATPDRLPLAGPVADAPGFRAAWEGLAQGRPTAAGPCLRPGLFVLSGLGSRGFTTAPLLAEHLAALIMGAPSPLPSPLGEAVHPSRFLVRALRRAGTPRSALSSQSPTLAGLP